jgi:hypothetical protein
LTVYEAAPVTGEKVSLNDPTLVPLDTVNAGALISDSTEILMVVEAVSPSESVAVIVSV